MISLKLLMLVKLGGFAIGEGSTNSNQQLKQYINSSHSDHVLTRKQQTQEHNFNENIIWEENVIIFYILHFNPIVTQYIFWLPLPQNFKRYRMRAS